MSTLTLSSLEAVALLAAATAILEERPEEIPEAVAEVMIDPLITAQKKLLTWLRSQWLPVEIEVPAQTGVD